MSLTMKVLIKRVDKSLNLPEYKTPGAAAMDLSAREDMVIKPRQVGKVPLNVILKVPDDHWVLMSARSSLHKKGLMMANGIGIGDADYCGETDEYQAALLNYTDQEVEVKRGERIVQIVILKREKVELQEVEKMSAKSRGGFGSTG